MIFHAEAVEQLFPTSYLTSHHGLAPVTLQSHDHNYMLASLPEFFNRICRLPAAEPVMELNGCFSTRRTRTTDPNRTFRSRSSCAARRSLGCGADAYAPAQPAGRLVQIARTSRRVRRRLEVYFHGPAAPTLAGVISLPRRSFTHRLPSPARRPPRPPAARSPNRT
jgi:hypothetical protein